MLIVTWMHARYFAVKLDVPVRARGDFSILSVVTCSSTNGPQGLSSLNEIRLCPCSGPSGDANVPKIKTENVFFCCKLDQPNQPQHIFTNRHFTVRMRAQQHACSHTKVRNFLTPRFAPYSIDSFWLNKVAFISLR